MYSKIGEIEVIEKIPCVASIRESTYVCNAIMDIKKRYG